MSAKPPTERAGAPPAALASAASAAIEPDPEPPRAFCDSRRLTGPARDHAGPAVILTPLGPARHDATAHAGWARRVRALALRLDWPDPQPVVRPDADEPALIFAAPAACLFTATEVNEWAWERSSTAAGHAVGAEAAGGEGFVAAQPICDDEVVVGAHFGEMMQREWRVDLAALRAAAAERALPWLEDEEQASIGSGEGVRVWTHTRAAAPASPSTMPHATPFASSVASSVASSLAPPRPSTSTSPKSPLASTPAPVTPAVAARPGVRAADEPVRIPLPEPATVAWTRLHAVPTALVTGSNGKTTTVRLLAAMAQAAGRVAGANTTEGVVVGGRGVAEGDYAGPAGARAVLRHPAVQVAVLETARGGLLRRGLALDRADVAVVTGIAADHFGEYGIRSLADLAEVKLVVARALVRPGGSPPPGTTARDTAADGVDPGATAALLVPSDASAPPTAPTGSSACAAQGTAATAPPPDVVTTPAAAPGWLVLNADDPVLMATAQRLPHARAARWALFAASLSHPALQACAAAGGPICGVHQGRLLLLAPGEPGHDLGEPADLPITLGGAATHNLANAAAAALAGHCLGLPMRAIAATLARFGADPDDNPGRLERWAWRGATVLVDYAHNPDGLGQLLVVAQRLLDLGSPPGPIDGPSERARDRLTERPTDRPTDLPSDLPTDLPIASPSATPDPPPIGTPLSAAADNAPHFNRVAANATNATNGTNGSTAHLSLLLGQAGNRSDDEIAALAHTAAAARPARIVIKELPHMRRGRAPGEVQALLLAALQAAGMPTGSLSLEADELSAAQLLLEAAEPGDVVVLPVHTAAVRRALAQRLRASA